MLSHPPIYYFGCKALPLSELFSPWASGEHTIMYTQLHAQSVIEVSLPFKIVCPVTNNHSQVEASSEYPYRSLYHSAAPQTSFCLLLSCMGIVCLTFATDHNVYWTSLWCQLECMKCMFIYAAICWDALQERCIYIGIMMCRQYVRCAWLFIYFSILILFAEGCSFLK